MPTIDLPQGTVSYREAGPTAPGAATHGPPVVFVHGFLVSGSLWTRTADALAAAGVRSYAPDWPLGSHRIPLRVGADQSPRGVARQVLAFLEALGLEDVTLVGNDSGGAICQFLLDTDATRIGRLVLTNCDAFDRFPPPPFDLVFRAFRRPTITRAFLAAGRVTAVRHSPLGYGPLVRDPLEGAQTRAWIEPGLRDAAIREDVARFVRAVDPAELLDVSTRLHRFDRPALLVWGAADRFFTLDSARRLAAILPGGRLVEVAGGRTFLPLDEPRRIADEIVGLYRASGLVEQGA